MKRHQTFFLLLFSFLSFFVNGQYYQPFVQGQSLPLYQNPSFAGTLVYPRFTIGSVMNGFTFPSPANLSRFYCSYDQYLPAIKSGIGFMYTSNPDIYVPIAAQRQQAEIFCSPKIQLKKKLTLSLGASIGFSGNVFSSKFVGYDSSFIYMNAGYNPTCTLQNPISLSYSAGAILHSPTFYIGVSIRRFPTVSPQYFEVDSLKLNFIQTDKFVSTAQLAYVFRKRKSDRTSFSPSLLLQLYPLDNGGTQLRYQVNLNFKRNFFFWGTGISTTSLFAMIGFHGEKIRLAYAGSWVVERINPNDPLRFCQEIVFSYTFIKRN